MLENDRKYTSQKGFVPAIPPGQAPLARMQDVAPPVPKQQRAEIVKAAMADDKPIAMRQHTLQAKAGRPRKQQGTLDVDAFAKIVTFTVPSSFAGSAIIGAVFSLSMKLWIALAVVATLVALAVFVYSEYSHSEGGVARRDVQAKERVDLAHAQNELVEIQGRNAVRMAAVQGMFKMNDAANGRIIDL